MHTSSPLLSSILVRNDRIMVSNARKYNIEAYYLLDEFDDVVKKIDV